MFQRAKGIPVNIDKHLVGKVTRYSYHLDENTFLILEGSEIELGGKYYLGVLSCQDEYDPTFSKNLVYGIPSLDYLAEGDIVAVAMDGGIQVLYRVHSTHNTIMATERCNSNCLMCLQPPKDRNDIQFYYQLNKRLISLIPKDCRELCVSGGEPTLMGQLFYDMMIHIKAELPDAEIHVLTNGRSFAWRHLAEKLRDIDNNKLMLGIPIYSDDYLTHDFIVQSENAYYQTLLGIHNLARLNQRIELRIVLHKLSIPRLKKLARYIYKNLPFAEHVVFMGLEYVGYAPFNEKKLWIDPINYQNELIDAVEFLSTVGMHVSIYNSQLCILPQRLWKFFRKVNSESNFDILHQCSTCSKLQECGGIFDWNLNKYSNFIKPF